ncbi:U3 small nucleolar RNA-associated protein 25 homolog [Phlebotomus papatasi]|uniref:U3 small nucleolar RNA-associated protein 25 homolog n=1 Tax=Phlebotomus papatasi TaxID=29031 RepID=UPI0024840852|nr:U3 small nucleolar RNA-associated protein 25 homolog [Phlebotomus papatasi]
MVKKVKNRNMKHGRKGNPHKKNYNHSRKNSRYKEMSKAKEKQKLGENYKFVKKMKNIQRNTENEEILRKRQQIEARNRKRQEEFVNNVQESDEDTEEEDNFYDKVLSMMNVSSKVSKAIETSSEEEDEREMSEEEKDEEDTGAPGAPGPSKRPKIEESPKKPSLEEENIQEEVDHGDSESEDDEKNLCDPFLKHLVHDMSPELYEAAKNGDNCEQKICSWPSLGRLLVSIPRSSKKSEEGRSKKKLLLLEDEEKFAEEGKIPERISAKDTNLQDLHIKSQLQENARNLCEKIHGERNFSNLQAEIFSILNNYQDLYMPRRTFENADEIRFSYCLHALNHALKSYTKISHHNTKIPKASGKSSKPEEVQKKCQDQGLVRPKILIILPFKNSAYHVINTLIALLAPELSGKVMNHKRFVEEFTGNELEFPRMNPKPADYEKIFAGNTDDNFRMGISVARKSLKLYAEFYSADFIIASPLGLRMIIGAAGDEKRDYDFLSSIEMLIIDQMDVILTQNWLHLLHIFDHLHLKLQTRKNTDFSRVRSWCLNGWSRFYRQTLLFSNHDLPEFVALLSKHCSNYRGSVRVANPIAAGSVQQVAQQVNQVFHRIEVKSLEVTHDTRFEYFTRTILPRLKASFMAHCLIYIPNYFDFVRIRNYFKKDFPNFVQVCEYTEDAKIARARDMFYHSGAHFMLYTERAHFYRRTRIRGIRHIVMYQPPSWPHFYPELLNLMQECYQNPRDGLEAHTSVTVLYTKYDALQMAAILGTDRTSEMLKSSKLTHTIMKEK